MMTHIIERFLSQNLCLAILLFVITAFEQYFVNLLPDGN